MTNNHLGSVLVYRRLFLAQPNTNLISFSFTVFFAFFFRIRFRYRLFFFFIIVALVDFFIYLFQACDVFPFCRLCVFFLVGEADMNRFCHFKTTSYRFEHNISQTFPIFAKTFICCCMLLKHHVQAYTHTHTHKHARIRTNQLRNIFVQCSTVM